MRKSELAAGLILVAAIMAASFVTACDATTTSAQSTEPSAEVGGDELAKTRPYMSFEDQAITGVPPSATVGDGLLPTVSVNWDALDPTQSVATVTTVPWLNERSAAIPSQTVSISTSSIPVVVSVAEFAVVNSQGIPEETDDNLTEVVCSYREGLSAVSANECFFWRDVDGLKIAVGESPQKYRVISAMWYPMTANVDEAAALQVSAAWASYPV